jgi:hypothetical protein
MYQIATLLDKYQQDKAVEGRMELRGEVLKPISMQVKALKSL